MLIGETGTPARGQEPYYARRSYRWITAVMGLFFIGLGLYVLGFAPASGAARYAAGAALVLLGCNAAHAAYRSRASWLSRIGPLP